MQELTVSARLDSDGTAATRSPEDLVGRGVAKVPRQGPRERAEVVLTGRGIAGRFATQKQS